MFSVTAPPPSEPDPDDPHLQVVVTPSASAFYAGEVFSAVITFRNTRDPISRPTSPLKADEHHLLARGGTPVSSKSRSPSPDWSNPHSSTWRGEHVRGPSKGHTRRVQSLNLGKGTMSPQEMVWALGGGDPPVRPPLPQRRSSGFPTAHPHARKVSIASTAFTSSPAPSFTPTMGTPPPGDPSKNWPTDPDTPQATSVTPSAPATAPVVRPPGFNVEPTVTPSPDETHENYSSSHLQPTPPLPPAGRLPVDTLPLTGTSKPRAVSTPALAGTSKSPATSTVPSSAGSSSRSSPKRHVRSPTYHDAAGIRLLSPPPQHPSVRLRPPQIQTGTATVLWAHTRLVAKFAPSHAYIPPDPLLPLRSKMLHQPVGSGTLGPSTGHQRSNSRWSFNFGTGALGNSTQPSLTGSLFGLAKGLVTGGSGGSLEEERKRVWSTQNLPVLETTRSLIGVDLKLGEGESRDFVYTLKLPSSLPPAFKGKALRFSYELVVSINVLLPGPGKKQRSKDFSIPIRVWPNVSVSHPTRVYDVLQPVIQTTEAGTVSERMTAPQSTGLGGPNNQNDILADKTDSLSGYAQRLLDTLEPMSDGVPRIPPSPSKQFRTLPSLGIPTKSIDPTGAKSPTLKSPKNQGLLIAAPSPRPRSSSIVAGDDELLEQNQRCGEAVEILSRHSPKASYDIRQHGDIVAVLTLVKTTYRLGETVLGVVTFNPSRSDRRVLKFSAMLETQELIPEPLLPPSAGSRGSRQPELHRVHAESRFGYCIQTTRTSFSLDIPSDATPAFEVGAGAEGKKGGLEWHLRLAFLVASPPRRVANGHSRSASRSAASTSNPLVPATPDDNKGAGPGPRKGKPAAQHLVPFEGDEDNRPWNAAPELVPFFDESDGWVEALAETVECEVPIKVLAGNTAFVVRPNTYIV